MADTLFGNGGPEHRTLYYYDFASARNLASDQPFNFESWAVTRLPGFAPNTRQVGDGGVDGRTDPRRANVPKYSAKCATLHVAPLELSPKSLARRVLALNEETAALARHIAPLVEELAPGLLALEGVGVASAGELMVAAGKNPARLRSEASFATLCGACPLPASSGKTQRHRLNRGGNCQANSALHTTVVCRMRTDQRTRAGSQPSRTGHASLPSPTPSARQGGDW